MQMPNILLPSIHPPPHSRTFTLVDSRELNLQSVVSARADSKTHAMYPTELFSFFLLLFLYSSTPYFYFPFFFMSSLLVKSDMEKTSCWRKDQDEKKKKSEDTFKMSVRERRDCVCVCCAIHGDATVAISLYSPSPSSTQQPPHPPFSLPPPLSRSTYEQRRSGTHHPSAVRIFHPHTHQRLQSISQCCCCSPETKKKEEEEC